MSSLFRILSLLTQIADNQHFAALYRLISRKIQSSIYLYYLRN